MKGHAADRAWGRGWGRLVAPLAALATLAAASPANAGVLGSASITVVKQARPKDGTNFPFVISGPGLMENFTLDDAVPDDGDMHTGTKTYAGLPAGSYTVMEQTVPSWPLTNIACVSNDPDSMFAVDFPGVTIALTDGEQVVCTFDNVGPENAATEIFVVKRTVGGEGTFNFTSAIFPPFSLTTVNTVATQHFDGLAAGTYDVSETVPAGWQLLPAGCSDGSSPDNIVLETNETVVCTFTNVRSEQATPAAAPALSHWGTVLLLIVVLLVAKLGMRARPTC